jgi:UMF1 family MFS transporter
MYDWANSVYALVIATALFPIYYNAVAPEKVALLGFMVDKTSLRAYAISFSYALMLIFGPYLGGVADTRNLKKVFLMIACYLGAIGCILLYGFDGDHVLWGIICFTIATFSYALGDSFYNAFLPEIATPDRFDRLSARGFSMGYAGSVILLVLALVLVMNASSFGMEKAIATKIGFVLTGVWWAGFGTYTFVHLRNRPRTITVDSPATGWAELIYCIKRVQHMPMTRWFLLTFLAYNTGVQTVMNISADFGTRELQLESNNLIIALLIIQLIGIGGAYLFSYISEQKGNIFTLKLAVIAWVGIVSYAYFIDSAVEFYSLGAMVGLLMGGTQATSRSAYSKLLPTDHNANASFFSFYSVLDKVAIISGTLVFGIVQQQTGSMRSAVIFLIFFFVLGLTLLLTGNWKRTDVRI